MRLAEFVREEFPNSRLPNPDYRETKYYGPQWNVMGALKWWEFRGMAYAVVTHDGICYFSRSGMDMEGFKLRERNRIKEETLEENPNHDSDNPDCAWNDPETYVNPALSGLPCNCPKKPPEKVWIDNPSPWHPMTDPVDLKHLGKLAEELAEAGSAVARCIIQGIDEKEPSTGKLNRQWLQDELADVLCNIWLVVDRFGLDNDAMNARTAKKAQHLKQWHKMA